MKNTTRIVTGVAFTAMLALSLIAGGGDAYAKVKAGGGQTNNNSGGTITFTAPIPMTETFEVLGITWE